jgi:hypothetical protein
MRIARAIPFLVLAATLVLVLAACGKGGGGY